MSWMWPSLTFPPTIPANLHYQFLSHRDDRPFISFPSPTSPSNIPFPPRTPLLCPGGGPVGRSDHDRLLAGAGEESRFHAIFTITIFHHNSHCWVHQWGRGCIQCMLMHANWTPAALGCLHRGPNRQPAKFAMLAAGVSDALPWQASQTPAAGRSVFTGSPLTTICRERAKHQMPIHAPVRPHIGDASMLPTGVSGAFLASRTPVGGEC